MWEMYFRLGSVLVLVSPLNDYIVKYGTPQTIISVWMSSLACCASLTTRVYIINVCYLTFEYYVYLVIHATDYANYPALL